MQKIKVDLTPDNRREFQRPTLYFSQGDVGREFAVDVSSNGGMSVPSGATVKIEATKPSGMGFSVSGTMSDATATFTSTAVMTDEAGKFPVELQVTSGNIVVGTANFNFLVEKDPHPEGTTDGQAEQLVPIITQLVERVEDAAESIHELNVQATTLEAGSDATAQYDEQTNTITFGIPRGNILTYTDAQADGNVVITKS